MVFPANAQVTLVVMRHLVSLLCLVLLAGCSNAPPMYGPERPTSTASATPTETVTPVPPREPKGEEEQEVEDDPAPTLDLRETAPDPQVMAAMECEPISEDTQQRIYALWGWEVDHGVRVEVGEGNTPSETWWIVTFAYSNTDHPDWGSWLTNQPGSPGERGQWIQAGTRMEVDGEFLPHLMGVDWDRERLTRGHSAIAKSWDCVGIDATTV